MIKTFQALSGLLLLLGAAVAYATPEEDRLRLVIYFKTRYPDVKPENYNYGALAFDPDSKAQYDAIMEFPPFVEEIEKGRKLWKTPFRNGKTYAECLPSGGRMIAGNYPMFDEAKGKVVTLEDVINICRVANGDEAYKLDDMKTMGLLTSYVRTLSDGMKMNIRVDGPAALKAYEDGKQTFFARKGQLNVSCANCHIDHALDHLRSELLSPVTGQATHWPVFRGGDTLVTLQKRYVGCFNSVRQVSDQEGSPRMNNLEYFHSYLSNGLEMKSSVFRK